jgi:ADP-dependent NAD(P)H-hydrate dehydratase / NAD(P)H-hydrate epimerase
MKIFSASQIRSWDAYTIEHEPIASLDLMERAASVFTRWLMELYPDTSRPIVVIAGTGNNGGDGLAVARMLDRAQYAAKVVVCDFDGRRSADFESQLDTISARSPVYPAIASTPSEAMAWLREVATPDTILVDALFGSGLNRPLVGDWAALVQQINALEREVVAIDLPSGLMADAPTPGDVVMHATRTFGFQTPKLAFFFPENAAFVGAWSFDSIGLHPTFAHNTATHFHYLQLETVQQWWKPRGKFAHKGTFGHALLIAGSWGKTGAAVLAARACLRSGTGLLTVHVPRCGQLILQITTPEAMVSADDKAKNWSSMPELDACTAVGVGPGIGRSVVTTGVMEQLLQKVTVPMVLDADALNILAEHPEWWPMVPANTILTPHPKEFERLFGKTPDSFTRNTLQREMAVRHQVIIVFKGAHTAITLPDGRCFFNSTGNPGMATGGSGDVLTGIITGLLAQQYPPEIAALLGVYWHGLAGDCAAATVSETCLIASDLVDGMRGGARVLAQRGK